MIDFATARSLGLRVERAKPGRKFGSFWGPNSQAQDYFGRVPGPVTLRFGRKVVVTVPEIKVIPPMVKEGLILLGTDVLTSGRSGWNFRSVGVE